MFKTIFDDMLEGGNRSTVKSDWLATTNGLSMLVIKGVNRFESVVSDVINVNNSDRS